MSFSVINIVSAIQIGKYQLHLCFDDGTAQDIDFGTSSASRSTPISEPIWIKLALVHPNWRLYAVLCGT